jgi:hypothetical protein
MTTREKKNGLSDTSRPSAAVYTPVWQPLTPAPQALSLESLAFAVSALDTPETHAWFTVDALGGPDPDGHRPSTAAWTSNQQFIYIAHPSSFALCESNCTRKNDC